MKMSEAEIRKDIESLLSPEAREVLLAAKALPLEEILEDMCRGHELLPIQKVKVAAFQAAVRALQEVSDEPD